MARPESIMKGGAYPLLPEWRPYLQALFEPQKEKHWTVLDPFGNRGETLKEVFADGLGGEPYLVEINKDFIEDAYSNIGVKRVLWSDAYATRISNLSFSVVYLNPPYDTEYESIDGAITSQRAEYKALKRFYMKVQDGGYLIYVVYNYHLNRPVYELLASNFTNIQVYRMPELHLGRYVQTVVIAKRKKGYQSDPYKIEKGYEKWKSLVIDNPEKIPDISKGPLRGQKLTIPATENVRTFLFESEKTDPAQMMMFLEEDGAHLTQAYKDITKPPEFDPIEAPIGRPNQDQFAVIIAAGLVNGVEVNEDGKRSLLRGSVVREDMPPIVEEEEVNGKLEIVERIRNAPQPRITVLSEDGTRKFITDDELLADFIGRHLVTLTDHYMELYQPKYDMSIDPQWGVTYDTHLIKGKYPAKTAQEYYTTAMTEQLLFWNHGLAIAEMSFGKTAIATYAAINLWRWENELNEEDRSRIVERYRNNGITKAPKGIKPGQVTIVLCPNTVPEKWISEIRLMHPKAVVRQVKTVAQARVMWESAAEKPNVQHFAVLTYDDNKYGEDVSAAYATKTKYFKVFEKDKDGFEVESVRSSVQVVCPVTGNLIMRRSGTEESPVRPDDMHKSKLFVNEEPYYIGWETYFDRLTNERKRRQAYIKLTRNHGFKLYSEKRKWGLPKGNNNGHVEWKWEERYIQRRGTQLKWPRDKYGEIIGQPYLVEYETKPRLIRRKKYAGVIDGEPVSDKWLSMQGVRPYMKVKNIRNIEKRMRELGYTRYEIGTADSDPALDKMLRNAKITEYEIQNTTVFRNPKYPLARYITRMFKGRIGFIILDEVHKTKSVVTDIGIESRRLQEAADRSIGLSGTIYGGYSSSFYSLMFVFKPRIRKEFPWPSSDQPWSWIMRYGVIEDVYRTKMEEVNGKYTGNERRKSNQRPKEVPGAGPDLAVMANSVGAYGRILDIGTDMPPYTEHPIGVRMDAVQRGIYKSAEGLLTDYNRQCIVRGDNSFTGSMFRNLLDHPSTSEQKRDVIHRTRLDKSDPNSKTIEKLVTSIPSAGEHIKPKEEEMMRLVEQHLRDSDRVIVSVSSTGKHDIQPRIQKLIRENVQGANVQILRAGDVSPQDRIEEIENLVAKGCNVLVMSPRLATEGVDLDMFQVIIVYQMEHSLYVMDQFVRRIWRLTQKKACNVYYLYHEDAKYEQAATYLIAAKRAAANVLTGAEGGQLSALADSGSLYSVIGKLVKEGFEITQDSIATHMKATSYTMEDMKKSPWWGPGRKQKVTETESGVSVVEYAS